MKLSRKIPSHTKSVEFLWCQKEFVKINEKFRAIRSRSSNKMDTCFWCRYKFENGEMMALAARAKGCNVVLCQKCANDLVRSKEGE